MKKKMRQRRGLHEENYSYKYTEIRSVEIEKKRSCIRKRIEKCQKTISESDISIKSTIYRRWIINEKYFKYPDTNERH